MKKINFIFGIHNHQPVGNFKEVLDHGYECAYKPFVQLMWRHPKIKWSLHCSGILWDYFREHNPEYIDIVKKMKDRGQVELIAGGYYEPIMPSLQDRDKIGQIKKMTEYLKNEFDSKPQGMWLAERVWEPHLPKPFSLAGIKYTIVDDYHLLSSGLNAEERTGYYITEEQGYTLKLFSINQQLRYYIPFKTVSETIEFFRQSATENEGTALVMIDDGEKFGMWPKTYKHVYEDLWLENFLKAVEENSDWINTLTFSEYLEKYPSKGRAYIPTASYFEMTEWAYPQKMQEELEDTIKETDHMNNSERIKKFIRGGMWRNFFTKYPESNNMHKKMLYVSEKINAYRSEISSSKETRDPNITAQLAKALDLLYEGQCNCAYWHGVFGGLYLPHLRKAIYEKLIASENIIDELNKKEKKAKKALKTDFDKDGNNEVLVETESQNLYFMPQCGGTIFEWDIKKANTNILNTLSRKKEAYHRKLVEFIARGPLNPGAVKTIHDLVEVKEENLDHYLNYDWYRKVSLIDHFIHPDTSYENFSKCKYGEQGDFVFGIYDFQEHNNSFKLARNGVVWAGDRQYKIRIEKEVKLSVAPEAEITYTVINNDTDTVSLNFVPELNFSFLGSRTEDTMNKTVKEWVRVDEPQKLKVEVKFENDTQLWVFPVETVSLSEAGFERTYQGTTVAPLWKLELKPGQKQKLHITIQIGVIE